MSDRLAELLRQRALLAEHVTWLDGEIAKASDPSGLPAGPTNSGSSASTATQPSFPSAASRPFAPAPGPAANRPAPTPAAGRTAPPDAEAIIDQYRSSPGSMQRDLRKGCFVYFAGALVLLALGVTALYFMISSR